MEDQNENNTNHIVILNPIWSDSQLKGNCTSIVNTTNINVALTKFNGFSLKPKDQFCDCPKCAALNVIKESLAHPGMYGFSNNKIKIPKILKGEKIRGNVKKKPSNENVQIAKKRPCTSPLLSDDPILTQIDEKLVTIFEKLDGLEKKIESHPKWNKKFIVFTDRSVQCAEKDQRNIENIRSNQPRGCKDSFRPLESETFQNVSNHLELTSSKATLTLNPELYKQSKMKEFRSRQRDSFRTSGIKKEPMYDNISGNSMDQSIGQKVFNDSVTRDLRESLGVSSRFNPRDSFGITLRESMRPYPKETTQLRTSKRHEYFNESNFNNRSKNTYYIQVEEDRKSVENKNSLIEIKDSIELNRILRLQYKNKKISDDLLKKFAKLDLRQINDLLKDYQMRQKSNRNQNEKMNPMWSSKIPIRKNIESKNPSLTSKEINRNVSNSTFNILQEDYPGLRRNDLNAYFVFLDQNDNEVIQNTNKLNECNKTLEFLSKKIENNCT